MKKVLLASTILVGTAGFAAAEVSFSGAAYVGLGYEMNAGTFGVEASSSLTATMTTTTDGGLEAGASIAVETASASFEDDPTEAAFGTYTAGAAGAVQADVNVYMSGDFGRLDVDYDASEADVTFTYGYSFGDIDLAAYYVWGTTDDGDMGASVDYTMGDYSVGLDVDYDAGAAEWSIDALASATFSSFTVDAEVNYNITTTTLTDWTVSAAYDAGAYSVGAFVSAGDTVGTTYDFGATASYDLGGGVSVDAAYTYDGDSTNSLIQAGVSMSF